MLKGFYHKMLSWLWALWSAPGAMEGPVWPLPSPADKFVLMIPHPSNPHLFGCHFPPVFNHARHMPNTHLICEKLLQKIKNWSFQDESTLTTATTLPPPAPPGPSAASWRLWARKRSRSATKTLKINFLIAFWVFSEVQMLSLLDNSLRY